MFKNTFHHLERVLFLCIFVFVIINQTNTNKMATLLLFGFILVAAAINKEMVSSVSIPLMILIVFTGIYDIMNGFSKK